MRVAVTIPDKEWASLVDRAEANGINATELVREAIINMFPGRLPMGEAIVRCVLAGIPDPVIAHRLGVTVNTVRYYRSRAGLAANVFHRSSWPELVTPRRRIA